MQNLIKLPYEQGDAALQTKMFWEIFAYEIRLRKNTHSLPRIYIFQNIM